MLLFDPSLYLMLFFFNDTATTEIYTLSLHDALPIFIQRINDYQVTIASAVEEQTATTGEMSRSIGEAAERSEEHTSELQSRRDLVCRLLLEKKKDIEHTNSTEGVAGVVV